MVAQGVGRATMIPLKQVCSGDCILTRAIVIGVLTDLARRTMGLRDGAITWDADDGLWVVRYLCYGKGTWHIDVASSLLTA